MSWDPSATNSIYIQMANQQIATDAARKEQKKLRMQKAKYLLEQAQQRYREAGLASPTYEITEDGITKDGAEGKNQWAQPGYNPIIYKNPNQSRTEFSPTKDENGNTDIDRAMMINYPDRTTEAQGTQGVVETPLQKVTPDNPDNAATAKLETKKTQEPAKKTDKKKDNKEEKSEILANHLRAIQSGDPTLMGATGTMLGMSQNLIPNVKVTPSQEPQIKKVQQGGIQTDYQENDFVSSEPRDRQMLEIKSLEDEAIRTMYQMDKGEDYGAAANNAMLDKLKYEIFRPTISKQSLLRSEMEFEPGKTGSYEQNFRAYPRVIGGGGGRGQRGYKPSPSNISYTTDNSYRNPTMSLGTIDKNTGTFLGGSSVVKMKVSDYSVYNEESAYKYIIKKLSSAGIQAKLVGNNPYSAESYSGEITGVVTALGTRFVAGPGGEILMQMNPGTSNITEASIVYGTDFIMRNSNPTSKDIGNSEEEMIRNLNVDPAELGYPGYDDY